MPTSGEIVSGAEHDEPETSSVYDFLYSDSARIASLLAQFDPAGHLTGAKMSESVEDSSGKTAGGSLRGGIPTIFDASGNFEGVVSQRAGESGERTYDPYWANARELLNLLSDRLVRDLSQARIGQFVMASGFLAVADLSLFRNVWKMPFLRSQVRAGMVDEPDEPLPGNRQDRRSDKSARDARKKANDEQADAVISMIDAMPHLIQARLETAGGEKLWASLREAGLVGTTHDLLLKHGTLISGQWTVVGVLDALPEVFQSGEVDPDGAERMARGHVMFEGGFGDLLNEIILPLRTLLGRPVNHYGLTPLMIFREIEASAQ